MNDDEEQRPETRVGGGTERRGEEGKRLPLHKPASALLTTSFTLSAADLCHSRFEHDSVLLTASAPNLWVGFDSAANVC